MGLKLPFPVDAFADVQCEFGMNFISGQPNTYNNFASRPDVSGHLSVTVVDCIMRRLSLTPLAVAAFIYGRITPLHLSYIRASFHQLIRSNTV